MSIEVTVDGNGIPTCDPSIQTKAKGNGKLTWQLKTAGYDFTDLQFSDPQPPPGVFSNKTVLANKITMDDDNPGGTAAVDYPYVISVAPQSTKPDQAGSVRLKGLGAGSAIIRNEPT